MQGVQGVQGVHGERGKRGEQSVLLTQTSSSSLDISMATVTPNQLNDELENTRS